MYFDMIPVAEIVDRPSLETNFLDVKLRHPVGLCSGIDNLGTVKIV
jgi:hypothetical protein